MAVLYFTSNADSGDGTLRDAIANANDGDVITYDPTVFTSGPIVISLSSYLPILPENATLDGGSLGIVLDGQNNSFSGYSAVRGTGTLTFINLTVKRYKVTTNSPIFVNSSSSTYVFKRCKFVDNIGVWYGVMRANKGAIELYDCLLTGNQATGSNSTHGGLSVNTDGTASAIAVRTIICGNVYGNLSGSTYLTQSGTFIGLTPPEIDGTAPEEIGFVNPPPAGAIPKGEYAEGDWQSWDFRLKPTSAYLTGAPYNPGDLDILGHTRTGSWGCYDGSWLVSTFSVSQDTTVNYADIQGAGTIADGAVVKVGKLYAAGGSVSASGRAYFCADTLAGLTFTNVVAATPSGVSAIAASIAENVATVDVTATGTGYVVEISDDLQSWTTLSLNNGKATLSNSNALYFRVFDGGFLRSEIVPRYYYYQGAASGGSFATASDWSLDKAGAIALSSKPTISGCYFDCRK